MKRAVLILLAILLAIAVPFAALYRIHRRAVERRERLARESVPVETVRITFPEGVTVTDVLDLLAEHGTADRDALEEAAASAAFDYAFLDGTGTGVRRLEGYLFPDTYDFYVPEAPERALGRLLDNFAKKLDGWRQPLAAMEERGYTLREILTVASLIEKETDGTDHGKIAAVIYNRLEDTDNRSGTNGFLQINASILYDLPGHTGPVTYADLETDSPYNTYLYKGLPPGPIANPGAASIEGALHPARSDAYFYALAKDGHHRFFETYSDFSAFLKSGDYVGN